MIPMSATTAEPNNPRERIRIETGAKRVRAYLGGGVVADTRRHRIYCQPDGTISIVQMPSRKTVMIKAGRKP